MHCDDLLISVDELRARLDDPGLRIVDCRFQLLDPQAGRRDYLEGHIPGAVYADLDRDLAGPVREDSGRHPLPDPGEFAATLGRLGIDRETAVVAYDDDTGAVASRAWWMLRWQGHDDVRLLDGGIAAWRHEGLPLEAGENRVAQRRFRSSPRAGLVIGADALLANIDTAEAGLLVDARAAARFRGEEEPIDAVAGHVPGAVNLPYDASLGAQGRWRSGEELAALWAGVLGAADERPWSVMCGSGVTACHLVVSALLAGRSEPRLYAGSWSEWIRDPDRPVATARRDERGQPADAEAT
jgi:thiosulfate/3-mercaptopyruvate sulfurtransferase